MSTTISTNLVDLLPPQEHFLESVHAGLSASQKQLPCKFFYDERGSQLFDQICELEEYYLTRTEIGIMEEHAPDMAARIGGRSGNSQNAPTNMLVEFGSGSSVKTPLLLEHLPASTAYVPVDISREHLHASAQRLQNAYPAIRVLPVCADFTEEFEIPHAIPQQGALSVYFPGSTIGNFPPDEAKSLLERIARIASPTGGGLLIGIDLRKDHNTLHAAYNDRHGVTADFNLNLLRRINYELNGDFDLDRFRHRALYNPRAGRMELFLESTDWQTVSIGGESFEFRPGERIRTEFSHKYTIDGFREIAESVGFRLENTWTDARDYFAVLYFGTSAAAE